MVSASGRRGRTSRKGVLSRTHRRTRKGIPLWQWLLITPVLAALVGAILCFVYLSYVHPRLTRGLRTQRATVIERKDVSRPDGTIDPTHSYLLVQINGKEVRLAPQPNWATVVKGDIVQVEYVEEADGSLRPMSWKR